MLMTNLFLSDSRSKGLIHLSPTIEALLGTFAWLDSKPNDNLCGSELAHVKRSR